MRCDDCKKRTANVHITQLIDDQQQERWLCAECAKAYGELALPLDKQFSFQDLLTGLLSHSYFNGQDVQTVSCSNCAMTYHEFETTGKFGCSECYTAFAQQLEPLLRRIHGSSRHNGKLPRRAGAKLEAALRIQRLRQELERCIRTEAYEEAARLRDEIRALEKENIGEKEGEADGKG
ncbi:UvrB/UvrC motif-containing protein [Azotosporobacter soli]|uniref:UvrB/UvrC motif-containing protein n=1 Tax=Azotosporobacter soli TaxID=3055040 RepID=UPI0031FE4484